MNHTAIEEFRRRGLAAKKSFGQNFLADRRIADAIAQLATEPDAAPTSRPHADPPRELGVGAGIGTVVEIGAGLGALTEPLLSHAAHVIAIERDRDLCPILAEAFADAAQQGRLKLLAADAKSVAYKDLFAKTPKPHVLAGNLPYQITGPLLEKSVELADHLDRAVFMVQAEVADRLTALPATANYGALTVFVTAAFRVERRLRVGKAAFVPRPGVDSAVILLTPHQPRRATETERFRQVVHAAFTQRRKTLRNAWSKLESKEDLQALALQTGIDLDRRGETLSVEEFSRFAAARL